jgi:hypothetical protein
VKILGEQQKQTFGVEMASSMISEEILPKDVLSDLVSERESSSIFMIDKDVMIPSRRSEII